MTPAGKVRHGTSTFADLFPQAIDPDFGPVGVETGVRPKGRIPVWAWLVAVAGVLAPVVAFASAVALMVAIGVSAFRANQNNARNQQAQAFEKAFGEMAKRGQGMAPGSSPHYRAPQCLQSKPSRSPMRIGRHPHGRIGMSDGPGLAIIPARRGKLKL
jgi:hypothetical protein